MGDIVLNNYKYILKIKTFFINFGPQHPAAHGVLRLILSISGEVIKGVTINIGLLHRGTEKLIESKTLNQSLPYFDRLDYVSVLAQEHIFCLAVEMCLQTKIPVRFSYIRMLGLELTRLLNHIMGITTHALDIGAMTPFLWGFEEREKIISLCEMLSGSRIHMGFFKPGGISQELPPYFLKSLHQFITAFIPRLNELEDLLSENRIWVGRILGVGKVSNTISKSYGASGPILRSSGIYWDLRKVVPYEYYSQLSFNIPLGISGDSYERFLIRVEEMRQSINILQQLENLFYSHSSLYLCSTLDSMEKVIFSFKGYNEAVNAVVDSYTSIEAPKGEMGVYLALDGTLRPLRCKITSPAYKHLQMLPYMTQGSYISDVVTVIGTQDIVFGEVDR